MLFRLTVIDIHCCFRKVLDLSMELSEGRSGRVKFCVNASVGLAYVEDRV